MREKFFYLASLAINAFKFRGFFRGGAIVGHMVVVRVFGPYWARRKKYRLFGLTFHFDDLGSLHHLLCEHLCNSAYLFRCGRKDPVIFDVGANVGDSAVYFKIMHPGARIIAFEPIKEAFELLRRNVESNGMKDVTLYNEALSNRDGRMAMYADQAGTHLTASSDERFSAINAGRPPGRTAASPPRQVEVRRFSDRFRSSGVGRIDLLKIDIEGGEAALIEDARDVLDRIDNIVIEYHLLDEVGKNSFDVIVSALQASGFRIGLFSAERNMVNAANNALLYIVATRS